MKSSRIVSDASQMPVSEDFQRAVLVLCLSKRLADSTLKKAMLGCEAKRCLACRLR